MRNLKFYKILTFPIDLDIFYRILIACHFSHSNTTAVSCRNIRYINQALQSIGLNKLPF